MTAPSPPLPQRLRWTGGIGTGLGGTDVLIGVPRPERVVTVSGGYLCLYKINLVDQPELLDAINLGSAAISRGADASGHLRVHGHDAGGTPRIGVVTAGPTTLSLTWGADVAPLSIRDMWVTHDGTETLVWDTGEVIRGYDAGGVQTWSTATPAAAEPDRVSGTVVGTIGAGTFVWLNSSPSTYGWTLPGTQTGTLPGTGAMSYLVDYDLPDLSGETLISQSITVRLMWGGAIGSSPTSNGVCTWNGTVVIPDETAAWDHFTGITEGTAAGIPSAHATITAGDSSTGAYWVYDSSVQGVTVDNSDRGGGSVELYNSSGARLGSDPYPFFRPVSVWVSPQDGLISAVSKAQGGYVTVTTFYVGAVWGYYSEWSIAVDYPDDTPTVADSYDGQLLIGPSSTGGSS